MKGKEIDIGMLQLSCVVGLSHGNNKFLDFTV